MIRTHFVYNTGQDAVQLQKIAKVDKFTDDFTLEIPCHHLLQHRL